MNYKIIQSEEELIKFINFLHDNTREEQYYLSLLGRNKWNKLEGWKGDQVQIKRFTSTKDRIFDKIKQLECKNDSYTNGDIILTEKNLGLYMMPNPRSLKDAQINLLMEISRNIKHNNFTGNPQAMALNEIQKSPSRKIFFDLDVDINKDEISCKLREDILKEVNSILDIGKNTSVFTNGGLHILVKTEEIKNVNANNWYQKIKKYSDENQKLFNIEMNGDNLLPVPGCIQGGWVPFMFK